MNSIHLSVEEEILQGFIEVEVSLENAPRVRETLKRIGILSKADNHLFQSCHLFKKKDRFYLTHFKEMYILNGTHSSFNEDDRGRRSKIATLLEKWGLLKILNPEMLGEIPTEKITIISHKDKANYVLIKKYNFDLKNSNFFVPT